MQVLLRLYHTFYKVDDPCDHTLIPGGVGTRHSYPPSPQQVHSASKESEPRSSEDFSPGYALS